MEVTSELIGREKIINKFDGYTGMLTGEINAAMETIAAYLVAYVKERKLSGQVLKRKTGALSRSIKGTVARQPGQIVAQITSRSRGNAPLPYAAFWEYGFSGEESVRAHVRKTASGGEANVRAFTRKVNQAARPFFAPTRDENQGYVRDMLQATINKANSK